MNEVDFAGMGPEFLLKLRRAVLAPGIHREVMLKELHALHRPDMNFSEWVAQAEEMARLYIDPYEQND